MKNELDVDSRLAWDKFSLLTKRILPSGGSLVYESSFQKNDDIRITLEKLFMQDKISLVYLPDPASISELVSDFRSQSVSNLYSSKLSEKNSSTKAMSFWEDCLRQKEEKELADAQAASNYSIFDLDFISKFESVCTNKNCILRLQEFYHVLGLNDSAFMQAYCVEEQNDSNIHSAEITKACAEGLNQHQINDMITKHFEKTEAKKKHFNKKFRERLDTNRKDFVGFIEKIYADELEKASSDNTFSTKGSVRGDRLSEKISRKSAEGEENLKERGYPLQMNSNLKKGSDKKAERPSESSFKIGLCLGSQRKYNYKVKILQADLEKFILQRESLFRGGLCHREKEIENCIYGINQKALVSVSFFDESGSINLDTKLTNCLKFNSDIHFHSYSSQIKKALNLKLPTIEKTVDLQNSKSSFGKTTTGLKQTGAGSPQTQLNNGDVFVTRHSNLGDLRLLFTLNFKNIIALQTESQWEFMRRVFTLANKFNIKSLVFSLESFLQSSFNAKQYIDMLGKILKMIRTELTALSHDYPLVHSLRKVLVLLPQNIDNPQGAFDKSKEVFKNCFE